MNFVRMYSSIRYSGWDMVITMSRTSEAIPRPCWQVASPSIGDDRLRTGGDIRVRSSINIIIGAALFRTAPFQFKPIRYRYPPETVSSRDRRSSVPKLPHPTESHARHILADEQVHRYLGRPPDGWVGQTAWDQDAVVAVGEGVE